MVTIAGVVGRVRRLVDRVAGSDPEFDRFLAPATREALALETDASPAALRALFKQQVRLVELEPHAYCNRTCSFCPNSTIDRLRVKTSIDRAMYTRILEDLAAIDYDGVLRFARYSEPMANDHIYDLVAEARRRLPGATIDIVSNGDYLDGGALARLREAGLSILRISVYLREGTPWTRQAAQGQIERLGLRIGIAPVFGQRTNLTVDGSFPFDGLPIEVYCHNFGVLGNDRGQTIDWKIDRSYVRRSPCYLPASNFTVDFDGKVMPCCNLRGDEPRHRRFVLGDLSDPAQRIFDIYASRAYAEWRRSLVRAGPKGSPCDTCNHKAIADDALERLGAAIDGRLVTIGVDLDPTD